MKEKAGRLFNYQYEKTFLLHLKGTVSQDGG
jgi:hypothetical protein